MVRAYIAAHQSNTPNAVAETEEFVAQCPETIIRDRKGKT